MKKTVRYYLTGILFGILFLVSSMVSAQAAVGDHYTVNVMAPFITQKHLSCWIISMKSVLHKEEELSLWTRLLWTQQCKEQWNVQ